MPKPDLSVIRRKRLVVTVVQVEPSAGFEEAWRRLFASLLTGKAPVECLKPKGGSENGSDFS